jgi:hypothetical protein
MKRSDVGLDLASSINTDDDDPPSGLYTTPRFSSRTDGPSPIHFEEIAGDMIFCSAFSSDGIDLDDKSSSNSISTASIRKIPSPIAASVPHFSPHVPKAKRIKSINKMPAGHSP